MLSCTYVSLAILGPATGRVHLASMVDLEPSGSSTRCVLSRAMSSFTSGALSCVSSSSTTTCYSTTPTWLVPSICPGLALCEVFDNMEAWRRLIQRLLLAARIAVRHIRTGGSV